MKVLHKLQIIKSVKKYKRLVLGLLIFCVAVFVFETFIPSSLFGKEVILYDARKGMGDEDIANDLKNIGVIKNSFFFELYVILSGYHGKIQAGKYEVSPSMSAAEIVKKMVLGEIVKERITILEGWTLEDVADYLESRELYSREEFLASAKGYVSKDLEFLKDRPKNASLEGYLFPDTYDVSYKEGVDDLISKVLENFDQKLTVQMKSDMILQKKSVFEVITMASILEKEVNSYKDKKIISGVLWKRIKEEIPLQVDATVNYATGKSDPKVSINDTKVDSPYNTYKYYGLPKGPISNPGLESILAAIYPEKTDYWYYLSADGTGKTIFSKTFDEHLAAQLNYFN